MRKITILLILFISAINIQAKARYVLTSDSVELYVNVKGYGPACLYLHGGPGSGSYWLEQFMGEELEQHFTMVYLDQRGVGRSSSPKDNNYSLDRMAQDFEEVRKAVGAKQWLTLGHSFGGILQMDYVQRYPAAISGMIFINCTLSMNNSFGDSWLPKAIELAGESTPDICKDESVSVYKRMLAIMPVLNEKGEMWKIFFSKEENSRKMNETYSNFSSWNSDLVEYVLELPEYWNDFRVLAADVKQPVLFFYGNKDWAVGPDHYKGIAFPNVLLHESDAAHMPFFENKDELLQAINQYVQVNKF